MSFCYPDKPAILDSWVAQLNNSKKVNFRLRGMNDFAFQILYDEVMKESTIPKCLKIFKEKKIEMDLSHNKINFENLSQEEKQFANQFIFENVRAAATKSHHYPSEQLNNQIAETNRILSEKIAFVSQQIAETNKELSEKIIETDRVLSKKITETNRETAERIAETDRLLSERINEMGKVLSEKITETGRVLSERIAEIDIALSKRITETNKALSERITETDRVFSEMISETDRMLSSKIDSLTTSVATLSTTTKMQEVICTKMCRDLEEKITTYIVDYYTTSSGEKFRKVTPEEAMMLQNIDGCPEFGDLLISKDNSTVIICEVEHRLTDSAFAQLVMREGIIRYVAIIANNPIPWLEDITCIRLLVGCEIFSSYQLDKVKKMKCIFVHPNCGRFDHIDYANETNDCFVLIDKTTQ